METLTLENVNSILKKMDKDIEFTIKKKSSSKNISKNHTKSQIVKYDFQVQKEDFEEIYKIVKYKSKHFWVKSNPQVKDMCWITLFAYA